MTTPTITKDWKVPITIVVSVVSLAIYGTVLYDNTNYKIDRLSEKLDWCVSTGQFQEFIDNLRDSNPSIKVPRLPDKKVQFNQMAATINIPLLK